MFARLSAKVLVCVMVVLTPSLVVSPLAIAQDPENVRLVYMTAGDVNMLPLDRMSWRLNSKN